MLVLDQEAVAELVDMDDAIAAVRRAALAAHAGGVAILPKERASRFGETLHVLGAVRCLDESTPPAQRWSSTTVYVTGSRRDHWTLLFNGEQGLVAALSGRYIARLRTGAASGVSVAASARPGPVTVACIGAGFQAWTQVEAVSRVREIAELVVWSRNRANADTFAAGVHDRFGLPTRAVTDVPDALRDADVALCVTKSRDPVILGRDLRPGTHVVLAGSSHLDRVESDPEVFARAGTVYADDLPLARTHGGDLNAAVRAGAVTWDEVSTLGAAVSGAGRTPRDPDEISVFCCHGIGSWDMEVAITAYARAQARG